MCVHKCLNQIQGCLAHQQKLGWVGKHYQLNVWRTNFKCRWSWLFLPTHPYSSQLFLFSMFSMTPRLQSLATANDYDFHILTTNSGPQQPLLMKISAKTTFDDQLW